MKDLVDYVVKGLVDRPDDVNVHEEDAYGATILEISVNNGDMGRVIGRRGKVINSIRSLVKAGSMNSKERYTVELLEN